MLDMADGWEIARKSEFFGALPENFGRALLSARRPISLRKGQTLFQRGDPVDAFFVVLSGWIKLSRWGANGEEIIVQVVRSGETFAEAAMFLKRTYPVNAEAATDAAVARIDANAVRTQIAADPDFAFAVLGSMSLRLRGLIDEIEHLKGRRAVARVGGFLLELCKMQADRNVTLELPFEKSLIAARLGISPESLSRALSKLRKAGVEVNGASVFIENRETLFRIVDGAEDN